MSKKIKCAVLTCALASVVAVSAALSACTIRTNHPGAKISISFNEKTYDIEYTLYRNMYPQTVQHFIELADAGFYNDTIIHDYKTNDWITGGYAYNDAQNNRLENLDYSNVTKLEYATAYSSTSMGEYLEESSKDAKYFEWFNKGAFSSSVYKKISYDKNGKETVATADALATLIGEFSENDHIIDRGALAATYGSLKMFYYDKGNSNQKVAIQNSFGQIMEHDYRYNCATSLFSLQVANSSSYSVSKYCTFAQLKNDKARGVLDDLLEAIKDYISNDLGGSSSKFTTSVLTKVELQDTFTEEGGREIETTFTMTSLPIVIKTVKITKY